ncbi:hypothetical protein [uncultured Jannaschia sp.]|uniref:hypothetical protein n=1 Tax=uncultured Jannaschia sp. TaxID=293347 RepID=UPI00260470D7|nr:hypothetical protein [uncultured Jannaschia sp.]
MISEVLRKNIPALIIFSLLLAVPEGAKACAMFRQPDRDFWASNASAIVDATVVDVTQSLLIETEPSSSSSQKENTWILQLKVHDVIKGDTSDTLFVATRVWNTTIVDDRYVLGLVRLRREFALVSPADATSSDFLPMPRDELPEIVFSLPKNEFHALGENGEPLYELWEGLCTSLPIFRLGTFGG